MSLRTRSGWFLVGALLAAACGGSSSNDDETTGSEAVSLTKLSEIEPGDVCESGGTLIETGIDEDESGSLDEGEISDSVNVCNGSDGTATDGAAGEDGVFVLSSISDASLDVCPAGGMVVSFGPDEDGSGTLEESEVESTSTICNGEAGQDACAPVLKVTAISPGSVCADGGVLVEYGQDSGATSSSSMGGAGGMGGASSALACDGLLSQDEVLASQAVCNGAEGPQGDTGEKGDTGATGPSGADGSNMAVSLTIIDPGDTCTDGGLQLDSGVDDNEDGVLQSAEIDQSEVTCF